MQKSENTVKNVINSAMQKNKTTVQNVIIGVHRDMEITNSTSNRDAEPLTTTS